MSNRIDLTQFEKITAGEWSIIRNGNRIDIGVGTSSAYSPIITFTAELAEVVMGIERDVADMNAIAAIPNLLAELKRCYERVDYLESVAEEYRQERPEEYCANCYAYLSEYDGEGVKECLCSDCEASEEVTK